MSKGWHFSFLTMHLAVLVLGCFFVTAFPANAAVKQGTESKSAVQEADKKTNAAVVSEEADFDYKTVSARMQKIEKSIKKNDFTRQSLDDAAAFLAEQEIVLEFVIKNVEKNSKYTQDALDALGAEPTDGTIEDKSIAKQRSKYTAEMNVYKNRVIEANLLKAEIARLTAIISDARSRILIGNLVAEQNVLVSPANFWVAISDAAVFFWKIAVSPVSWYKGLSAEDRANIWHNSWYVLLILGLAFSFGLYIRSFIIRKWGYGHTEDYPRYGQKIVVAIITAIAYGVIPSLLMGGCLLWQLSYDTLTHSQFGAVLASILWYALIITLICALARVILAPWNGRWRLFNISDERAEKVFMATTLSIILLGIVGCIRHLSQYFDSSDALTLFLEVSGDAVKAFVIILMAMRIFGRVRVKSAVSSDAGVKEVAGSGIKADEKTVVAETQGEDDEEELSVSSRIVIFTTLFAVITFGISLFGYPGLATFIFNRFILSALLIGAFTIIRLFISDLLRRSIVFWIKTFKMRKKLLSKADLLISLIVTPLLAMGLLYLLLTIWGMSGALMGQALKKLIFGFQVGGISISLISIITGLLVFIISLTLVRILKARLSNNLLTRINMDEGIKHSLISGFSFTGVIIASILGIVAMGVDLSNLAVIAGALSVGIGFGLQDVIKNLVSGIILLFERPFNVGDWVIIGGEEGKIKQINIRSTEVETFNKASLIIPNATLLSSSLTNLTHGNNWQRQSISVGVSYDSDADQVTRLLLECARNCKKVMKIPAPYVVFKDFGESSLDFELRIYVSDIWSGWSASSDIRYEILRRFREEGIDIAYPQIVLHQGGDDASAESRKTDA